MSAQVIEQFYSAFARRDAEGMVACYHPQVVFNDPVFTALQGERAGAMWKMLVERGKDLAVTYRDVQSDGKTGRAHWEATYTFSQSGHKVHNVVEAHFTFRDGKIIAHTDSFNFYRWASQALGTTGRLLGWTPMVRAKVQKTALAGLEKYLARNTDK